MSSKILRVSGFVGTVGLTAALVGVAATGTGAYFSDAKSGTISGTMGTIAVEGSGGSGADHLNFSFEKMLPGEAQAKTVGYKNVGQNVQDVWVVFDQNALGDFNHSTDAGLVNDLGRYGEIHVKTSGNSVFDSANLNDDATSCPPAGTDCAPLPNMIRLRENLVPGAEGNMTFSFKPGEKFKSNQGAPVLHLPYKIVATQHGIAPNDGNSTPITF